MNLKDLKLGHLYAIEYFDHFELERKNIPEAVQTGELILNSFGKLIAITDNYIIICYNYDMDPKNENNDYMFVFKKAIKKIEKLTPKRSKK